jgi:hypothetical protein
LLCILAEQNDLVLTFVKVETQTRFDVALTWSIVRARDVIDVNDKSAALWMSEIYKLHIVSSKRMSG